MKNLHTVSNRFERQSNKIVPMIYRPTLMQTLKVGSKSYDKDLAKALKRLNTQKINEIRGKYHTRGYCINLRGLCEEDNCECFNEKALKESGYTKVEIKNIIKK